uniref:Structural maintenance of chromosomes protein 5 n=1 Tax=Acrobeloides nanus TaxID=290746 RepID=A0A914D987_9BILA
MVILQADGYPEYHEGAIVKIFFKNFLTYDDVICEPGPKLNVIIGPNGTGKSTIICGICLALGGHPKVLGRSDNIGDFIKHGKDSGSVEVYIKDSKLRVGYRRFRIQINHPNKPAYYIDDKKVSSVEVQRYADEYNIQVTNPCTFLAQDK